MKRRDFLKLGVKAAVGLPALALLPAVAKTETLTMRNGSTIAFREDPFEKAAKFGWKSWQEGVVVNEGWDDNIMKQLGENTAKTVEQLWAKVRENHHKRLI